MGRATSIRGPVLALAVALAVAGPARGAANFHIRGGGDGHGIGMSQYGAYGYAQHGRDYRWILAHYYQGTSLGVLDREPVVRVLIRTGASAFSGASVAGGTRLDPSTTYSLHQLANGQLSLLDDHGKEVARYVGAPLVVTGPGPLAVAGTGLYRGALELRPDGSGGIETVNALGLEDYVRGVISAEMPAGWAPEALKVQAVAARTYALTTDAGGGVFDQYADTRSQMYRGVAAETPSTDAAVAATRGLVVTYDGRPAVTYFFNSSGGHTENVENVWPRATPEPWLRGVVDPYDGAGGDPYHAWGEDMPVAAATAKLGGLVKGSFVGIQVTRHGSSPRVISAAVVGSGGITTVTGPRLQSIFRLLTTNATFTTISTRPASGGPAGANAAGGAAAAAAGPQSMTALVPLVQALEPLVHALVASVTPELTGRVFPGQPGEPITLQERVPGGWRTAGSATLGVGGAFTIPSRHPGTYRVQYRSLQGPAVSIH
jgi:stage II sporulation protein D